MRVTCEVTLEDVARVDGSLTPGVTVQCGRCNHCVSILGQQDKSIKRALATLRQECKEGEENYYVDGDE